VDDRLEQKNSLLAISHRNT